MPDPVPRRIASHEVLAQRLEAAGYLADRTTALSLWLALELSKPLLVEGPAGVGKTDLARAAAEALSRPLVRLQCYEGLDEAKALYEWDYGKQLLFTQLLRDVIANEVEGVSSVAVASEVAGRAEATFFSDRFLIARPLLRALRSAVPVVLLIDEVDRADTEFEAFLLELLAELQVTIPELGTFKVSADAPPLILLTSNGTREMTEALRRRCLHAFLDYPTPSRELSILRLALPGIDEALAQELVAFVGALRRLGLEKSPAVSETLDFARALVLLGKRSLDREVVEATLGLLVKHQVDKSKVESKIDTLLRDAS